MSEQDLNDPRTRTGGDDDWLVQLVRAPAGTVLLSGGRENPQPPPLPEAADTSPAGAAPPPLPDAGPPPLPDVAPPPLPQAEGSSSEAQAPAAAPSEPAAPPPTEAPEGAGTAPVTAEPPPGVSAGGPATSEADGETVQELALEAIRPNPDQPRRTFDPDELAALAASIAEQGVIQPVVVRPAADAPGAYQLVVGERRWRAARLAGLAMIPAIVRRLDDEQTAEIALVENIQRADLPPLEEARAYAQLIDRHGQSQDSLARRLGKDRSHIGHMLRLLRLPEAVQRMIADGAISVGHARLLVSVDDPQALAERIVAEGLSVRQTEIAAKSARAAEPRRPAPAPAGPDPAAWADRFGAVLDRPVAVKPGRQGGSVVIRYHTEDDLAAILARMGG